MEFIANLIVFTCIMLIFGNAIVVYKLCRLECIADSILKLVIHTEVCAEILVTLATENEGYEKMKKIIKIVGERDRKKQNDC